MTINAAWFQAREFCRTNFDSKYKKNVTLWCILIYKQKYLFHLMLLVDFAMFFIASICFSYIFFYFFLGGGGGSQSNQTWNINHMRITSSLTYSWIDMNMCSRLYYRFVAEPCNADADVISHHKICGGYNWLKTRKANAIVNVTNVYHSDVNHYISNVPFSLYARFKINLHIFIEKHYDK